MTPSPPASDTTAEEFVNDEGADFFLRDLLDFGNFLSSSRQITPAININATPTSTTSMFVIRHTQLRKRKAKIKEQKMGGMQKDRQAM